MNARSLLPALRTRLLPVLGLATAAISHLPMNAQSTVEPKEKVLFVVTSHDRIEKTGKPTGFYLSEVTHPWAILVAAGYDVDFVSPQGGKAPVDGFNLDDPINRKFWEDPAWRAKIEHTKRPAEIDPVNYAAIHFAGGHGVMWDFPGDAALAGIAAKIYENGGIVSAVCHGPAGLVNIKLANGKHLVDGKRVNAFTNEEETEVGLSGVVPFLLETRLIERGAIFEKSAPWQSHAVVDQRLVTGQNPQSAQAVGEALREQLAQRHVIGRLTRYDVKPDDRENFKQALSAYVARALQETGNVHAEAYHEREKPSVLWLIERWQDRRELERFAHSPQARVVEVLQAKALEKPAEVYHVTDLEPLTRAQWRQPPRAADQPLVVMLFVDARPGTQEEFKARYHIAMPQFRGEPGVVTYGLSQVTDDDTKFVTFEKFRSDAAFDYHLKFPAVNPILDYLNTSIKRPPFQDGLHLLIEFAPLTRE